MPGANGGTYFLTTTDAVVGVSAKPTRVFFMTVLSGGTASVVKLYNGTSTGGQIFHQLDGTISKSVTVYFGAQGLLFPAGCFVDVDANTAGGAIAFETQP